jgi:hypothetical protein
MNRRLFQTAAIAAIAVAMLGCEENTSPILHKNVDQARDTWLQTRPAAYVFEVQTSSSWSPPGGFARVHVSNGHVVSATDASGKPVTNFQLTIDTIWNSILTARAKGELNDAQFDSRGVPIETDYGPWAVDGGVHYSVRRFAAED